MVEEISSEERLVNLVIVSTQLSYFDYNKDNINLKVMAESYQLFSTLNDILKKLQTIVNNTPEGYNRYLLTEAIMIGSIALGPRSIPELSFQEQYKLAHQRLLEEKKWIENACTHPAIGEIFMWSCSDCGYAPDEIGELSDYDREKYQRNIEEARIYNRRKKAKFSRDEIKSMKANVEQRLDLLKKQNIGPK